MVATCRFTILHLQDSFAGATDCHRPHLCRCSWTNSTAAKVTEEARIGQQQARGCTCRRERSLQTPFTAMQEVSKIKAPLSTVNRGETQKIEPGAF